MPLTPETRAFLETLGGGLTVNYDELSVEMIRKGFDAVTVSPAPEDVHDVAAHSLPGAGGDIPVRLYRPRAESGLPGIVYFHGGGFVTGSLDSHDGVCRSLANAADCAVLSVDYRLAPEHPFPAAADDCIAATRWLAEHGENVGVDGTRLAVAGDSAGGNLAAVTAQACRDGGGPALRHQLLIYPVIERNFETASYRDNAEGYFLTRDIMRWFWDKYLPDEADAQRANACPSRAESLRGLAPASVLTAEFDPLRDEGEAYAEALQQAGVATERVRYDGQIHGFMLWPDRLPRGREAIEHSAQILRRALA